jgi:hypothetical protein
VKGLLSPGENSVAVCNNSNNNNNNNNNTRREKCRAKGSGK